VFENPSLFLFLNGLFRVIFELFCFLDLHPIILEFFFAIFDQLYVEHIKLLGTFNMQWLDGFFFGLTLELQRIVDVQFYVRNEFEK